MGKKRSEVWNYFIRDDEKLRAHCRYCDQSVSILGGNISNLTRHLKKKHAKISLTRLLSGEVVSFNDSEEQESVRYVASSELVAACGKAPVGQVYIQEKDDVLPGIDVVRGACAKPITEVLSIKEPQASRKNKSDVWEHFTKYQSSDARRRIGKCHYCPKIVSASGGISNLKRHLVVKHADKLSEAAKSHATKSLALESHEVAAPESHEATGPESHKEVGPESHEEAVLEFHEQNEFHDVASPSLIDSTAVHDVEVPNSVMVNVLEKSSPSSRRSRIWGHFTANEFNTKAECNHCGTKISMCYGSLGNLFRHLRKKHPKIRIPKVPLAKSRPVEKVMRSDLIPMFPQPDMSAMAKLKAKPPGSGKKVSDVWKHFTKLRSADNTRIRGECHYCKRLVSASSGSISNLKRHLRKKHPRQCSPMAKSGVSDRSDVADALTLLQRTPKPRLSSLTAPAARAHSVQSDEFEVSVCDDYLQPSSSANPVILKLSAPTDTSGLLSADRKKNIDKHLVKLVCRGFHHPSSFYESTSFKDLLQTINPAYELISLHDFKNSLLPKTLEEIRMDVHAKLNMAYAVCLSTESWTTSEEKRFCMLKAHYITSGEPHCSTLSCSEFINSYAPEDIAVWFQTTVIQWNLDGKIIGIVTDDSIEMTVGSEFSNYHRLPCFAYTLNEIVFKGLKEVDDFVVKVRTASVHIRSSLQITNNFHEIQGQAGLPKFKLKKDNPAVWATTCKMLERFLLNKDSVVPTLVQSNYSEEEVRLLYGAWEIIEGIVSILNLFGEVVKDLSAEKSVVLSRVPILLRIISDRLNSFVGLPNEVEVMRTVILEEFNAKFDLAKLEMDPLVGAAVLLDPRFKKEGFSCEDHFSYAKNAVISELGSSMLTLPASESHDGFMSVSSQSSSLWADFDKLVKQAVDVSSQSPSFVVELENYLAEPLIPRTENPLVWWNTRKAVYPTLHSLMLKKLCTPASAVPFKRLFSEEGFVVTDRRFHLNSSKLIPMIAFLHQNL